jgi:hypothetical protein
MMWVRPEQHPPADGEERVERTATHGEMLADALEVEQRRQKDAGRDVGWPPPPAPGWAHLPIVAIDLVLNLSRSYEDVVLPAIRSYVAHAAAADPHVSDSDDLLASYARAEQDTFRPHTLDDALGLLEQLDTGERQVLFGIGNLRAYRRTDAPLRADTVLTAMRRIRSVGCNTAPDLRNALIANPDAVRDAVRGVPGIGKAGWSYLPLLVDLDQVKRDVHVNRFLDQHLPGPLDDDDVRDAFDGARALIEQRTGAPCTIRGLEHFVWRIQSGQPPLLG